MSTSGMRRRSRVRAANSSHHADALGQAQGADAAARGASAGGSSRTAVFALYLGNAIQWYDFALYGAFATVIGPIFFAAQNPSTVMLAAFATYGIALVVRPFGALMFGRLADVRGRRAVFVLIILIMAGATATVGLLPGYAAIGVLAPVTLILLRALQGLAAGGELGVAGTLILEAAPSRRWGQMGSWHTATLALGLGFGMGVASFLLVIQLSDPSQAGWWRLAFLLALPLGLIGGFVRRRVNETRQFVAASQAGQTVRQPIRKLWADSRLAVLRGFALIAAGSGAFNSFFIFMPNHLAATRKLDLPFTLLLSAAALVVTAIAAVTLGQLSDIVGRRPVAIWSSAALAVLGIPMSILASTSQTGLLLAQLIMGAALAGVLLVAMVGELFPTALRATGMAMTAGLATALVGGTAPAVDQILVTALNLNAAPGVYLSVVACLALVALWRWPETAFKPAIS
jgi:MFS transporter, MHS family, proline/betaine transporter